MRIIGGKFRSRVLVEFKGEEVRPTADRVKESLFNILSLKLIGARVLDLFSGSGALGIECLSRGAKEVVFNDASKDSVKILEKNLALLKVKKGEEAKVYNLDFVACLGVMRGEFDVIFLDPPYRFDYGKQALEIIASCKLLSENGIAVCERDRPFEGSVEGLYKYDERKYGKTYLTFFTKE
ncbi:MAG: 16S rRNA (guanine(966)-N(2))-methyltransferase RsmD [Clostridia bacterium]|nr:16S rRNA (guanine(966)-N(2))-methyltransferase RsmD [Clostridia bacterium]